MVFDNDKKKLLIWQNFTNNILVGKNLDKNKTFGEHKSVDWVSKINPPSKREDEIQSYFDDTKTDFHYHDDLSEFNIFIETFQQERYDDYSRDYSK